MAQAANHPRAECKKHDPELWFPVSEHAASQPQIEQAKAICVVCPLQEACLDDALQNRIEFGIWGGHTANERRKMLGLPGRIRAQATRRINGDPNDRTELIRQMASPS